MTSGLLLSCFTLHAVKIATKIKSAAAAIAIAAITPEDSGRGSDADLFTGDVAADAGTVVMVTDVVDGAEMAEKAKDVVVELVLDKLDETTEELLLATLVPLVLFATLTLGPLATSSPSALHTFPPSSLLHSHTTVFPCCVLRKLIWQYEPLGIAFANVYVKGEEAPLQT